MNKEMNNQNQKIESRPPIVVVLGHVDHGKTKILDYIRKTKVAEKEAGGITQHIGAYQVEVPFKKEGDSNHFQNRKITFLDTPGHEAFLAIRSRGAQIADIAILVVAADEGVKPQTKEAFNHIKEAKIPFIVAINKIDKEGANPNMVKQQLAEIGVLVEGWGGQIPVVETSAKTGRGIDELLELILLSAELEGLKASQNKKAKGVIIESHLDPKRGFVATLIIQDGTLKLNDYVVSGSTWAKIKLMENFLGENVIKALPSSPVLTLGWTESPEIGEKFQAVDSKEEAEKIAKETLKIKKPLFLKEFGAEKENKKLLDIVFKADTFSSLEAIDEAIKNIKSEEVGYNVIGYGIGNINENDLKMIIPTNGIVYGFYVGLEDLAKRLAEKEKVRAKTFKVIYELVEELKRDLSELLEPEIKRTVLGKVKILKTFKKGVNFQIVGGKVIFGLVKRGFLVDVFRDNVKILSGRLSQLQHNKVDVEEVKEGLECGMKFEGLPQIQEGDILEIYQEEKIKRSI